METQLTMAECARQCRSIRETVDVLRRTATNAGLTLAKSDATEGYLLAAEQLLGMAWAGFHGAANHQRAYRGEALVAPFTEAQKAYADERREILADKCLDIMDEANRARLSDEDRAEAEEAAGRA